MTKIALNKAQEAAVEHKTGPALVVAGAGTGKTRVIVERMHKLLEQGVPAQAIAALTFTEKAAQEMTDRLNELRGGYNFDIQIATFNSFGEQLLRRFASDIGLHSNFKVLSDVGQVIFLKEHLAELQLDYYAPVSNPEGMISEIADYFSQLKQHVVTPTKYISYAEKLRATDEADALEKKRHTELAHAYNAYIELSKKHSVVDYDDQIYALTQLLVNRPNIAQRLQDELAYILVDEFQDTNPMQSILLSMLINKDKNIMVVGDDDQSIYGFRGATIQNILEFTDKYPKAHQIVLTENYRSSQEILDASYELITNNNPDRLEFKNGLNKKLHAQTNNVAPGLHQFNALEEELTYVCESISALLKNGTSSDEIAVLTRKNNIALQVHERLEQNGIESRLAGQTHDLFKEPLVRAFTDCLVALQDVRNNTALYYVLSGPLFNITGAKISDAAAQARREHSELRLTLLALEDTTISEALTQLQQWREAMATKSVGSLCFEILESSGLKDRLLRDDEDIESARNVLHLSQFFTRLKDYEKTAVHTHTAAFLENLPLLTTASERSNDDLTTALDTSAVSVMTIHKSKGLEWDHVFIVDVTQGTLPSRKRGSSLVVPLELSNNAEQDHLQEERRLLYVAMTRARETLVLSTAFFHSAKTAKKPSQFLSEIFDSVETNVNAGAARPKLDMFADKPTKSATAKQLIKNGVLTLSVSQLNDYLRCPYDFYYRHILCVPQEPSGTLQIGSLLHGIIERYNKAKLAGDTIDEPLLIAELEENAPKEGFISKQERTRALVNAKHAIHAFLDRERMLSRTPNKIESPFIIMLNEAKIVGRYDAVYDYEDGVEIRDYKSSDTVKDDIKAKKRAQTSDQLTVYALAWQQMHGDLPTTVSLDFFGTGFIGSVKKTQRGIDTMTQKITDAIDGIKANSYPKGIDHTYCTHT